MITKNSVVKIQNLVVNHESRPVKSNPVGEGGGEGKICLPTMQVQSYLIMGPLLKLISEIFDKEKKGDPLFLFFVANLIYELAGRWLIFFML